MDIPNFRDIGGIETVNGRRIRTGLLLRSAALSGATASGLASLQSGGLAHIVDLRTKAETTASPDPQIPGAAEHHLDVFGNTSAVGVADLQGTLGDVAGANQAMITAYRNMVSLPSAHDAYRQFLFLALRGEPLLFHCTEGKDRTGWGAALLLDLLQASPEQIEADYLKSTAGLVEQNAIMAHKLEKQSPDVNKAVLDVYLSVAPEFLQAAITEANNRYGSVKAYASAALSFGDPEIKELRRVCLE